MRKLILLVVGFALALSACSSTAPVTENKSGTVKKANVYRVQQGVVTSTKNVAVLEKKTHVVRTVGSLAGSILGSGSIAGSFIGSMIGGTVGASADTELSKKPGLEISLKLDNGENVIVTQTASKRFKVGDRIKLLLNGEQAQVVHL